MFKRLFLGTTQIDFKDIGPRFYRIFIIEMLIFGAILIASLFGVLSLNLSVDFTGGTTYQLDTEYSDNDIADVLGNSILEVSRYQTFENSNTLIFRAVESSQENEIGISLSELPAYFLTRSNSMVPESPFLLSPPYTESPTMNPISSS